MADLTASFGVLATMTRSVHGGLLRENDENKEMVWTPVQTVSTAISTARCAMQYVMVGNFEYAVC